MIVAKINASDRILVAEWLNKYIEFTNQLTIDSIERDVNKYINQKIEDIVRSINRLHTGEITKKEDMKILLHEAYLTAKKLEIKQNANLRLINTTPKEGGVINCVIIS